MRFVILGVGVALAVAFFLSPLASSAPDGLERVAIDQGFESQASTHLTAGSPLADYSVAGVGNSWMSTGLSGIVGVALCFLLAGALMLGMRITRRRRPAPGSPASPAGSEPPAGPAGAAGPDGAAGQDGHAEPSPAALPGNPSQG